MNYLLPNRLLFRQPSRVAALHFAVTWGLAFLCLALFGPRAWAQTPETTAPGAEASGQVRVVDVDDAMYPAVSLAVDVVDGAGVPVGNLTADAFTVTVDGQPAAMIGVAPDSTRPLALLLSLDRSTDAATWAAVQAAATDAVASLLPDDQVALTTFFDQVEPVLDFTADKEAALAALSGVVPGGEFSALNPAIVDAVGRFGPDLPLRRAVVMVADAPDNISDVTTAQAIAQATAQGVPVYVVGFGERVLNEPSFAQIAAATGGRSFAVGSAAELSAVLTTLLQELHQGYRVDVRAPLPADGAEHTAQINVNTSTVTGGGSILFTAHAGEIDVAVTNLVAGQPVGGVVTFAISATTPGPVANVLVEVDGVQVGAASDLQTPIAWDTEMAEPGAHSVRVVVEDSVGNRGETTLEVVTPAALSRLDLLHVDDGAYPAVAAYVDVFGPNGLPLVGLSPADFTVREENRPLDAGTVAVQVDGSQPLHWVLVLDRSVSVADWTQLRNAANAFIDLMRPQDQMAIYTFAEEVTLAQPPVADAAALRAALAMVQAAVPTPESPADNALNQALVDAANLAATLPQGRRAVVVITSGLDNTGHLGLDQVIAVLDGQPVPVHILGFGLNAAGAATVSGLAQMAGGSATVLNTAAEVRGALETLAGLLQNGYRLDFSAGLQVDDSAHPLEITVAAQEIEASSSGTLVARRRPMTVTIPSVAEGDQIGGAVDLTAQVDAPSPLVSVEYLLNGDELAEVEDTSFRIVWNSDTVSPGDYTLEVNAVDSVGNQGRAQVHFTVVAPLTVQGALGPRNTDGDIVVGDDVTVNATVEALADEVTVEFFLDETLVATDNRAPYSAMIDTATLAPGLHTIATVARDNEGRQAVSTFDFTLVAPLDATPVPGATITAGVLMPAAVTNFNWGRWLGLIALAIVLLVLLLVVLAVARSARHAAQEQKLTPIRLALSNQGNVATGFLLRGDDPAGQLTFRFSLNGAPLGLPPVARLTREEQAANGGAARLGTSGTNGTNGTNGHGPSLNLPQGAGTVPVPNAKEIGEWGDRLDDASRTGMLIASLLTSIAMVLPRNLARPVRTLAMQIRRGNMFARRLSRVRRQFDRLNRDEMGGQLVEQSTAAAQEAGRVATAEGTQQMIATGGQSAGSAASATWARAGRTANRLYELGATATRQASQQAASALGMASGAPQWVYVPPLDPGQSVHIDVLVGARSEIKGSQHMAFRILSRALNEEDDPPVIEEGSVRIVGRSWWQRHGGKIIVAGLALVTLTVAWIGFTLVF